MPTYEYECRKCGGRFERFQMITAKPVRKCPECGGAVKRLLGAGSAILTGGAGSSGPAPSCGPDAPCAGRGASCPFGR